MGKEKKYDIVRSGLLVSAITLIAKIISFGRDMLLANYFGATFISDIILTSTTLLLLLTTFIRSSFAAAYLPIATDVYFSGDLQKRERFFSTIYETAFIIGFILMLLEAVFIEPLIHILMPGFEGETLQTLKLMMLIQLPIVPLSFLGAVNSGNLRLLNKFGVSEISTGLIALFYVIYLILYKQNANAIGISICADFAYFFSFLLCFSVVYSSNIKLKCFFKLKEIVHDCKIIFFAMLPFMLSNSVKEINVFADKTFASLLEPGSITMQTYASKMTVTEVGLIATAISLVVFSQASKVNTLGDKEKLCEIVESGINFVNTLMIPCCVLTIVYSSEIITVLFGRGDFTSENVRITANTMAIYAVGLCGAGIEEVLLNTMYATKHRNYPMVVSIISIIINILLNILLYKPFGIYGLALSSTFVMLGKVPFYVFYVVVNIVPSLRKKSLIKDMFRTVVAATLMGIFGWQCKYYLSFFVQATWLILFLSVVLSLCVLCTLLIYLNNEYALKGFYKIRHLFNS